MQYLIYIYQSATSILCFIIGVLIYILEFLHFSKATSILYFIIGVLIYILEFLHFSKAVWNDERECSSCWVRHSDDRGIGVAVFLF